MSTVSVMKCDACGKTLDVLQGTWVGVSFVRRALPLPDGPQHACDAACLLTVMQTAAKAITEDVKKAREAAKAKTP